MHFSLLTKDVELSIISYVDYRGDNMIVDLSTALKVEGSKVDIDTVLDIEPLELGGNTFDFAQPVHIVGAITNESGRLKLNAQVNGSVNVHCYRCLKGLQRDFLFTMEETIISEDMAVPEDQDVICIQNGKLDLKDIVINNILVNMSMKYLCSEDCKGLCAKCGTDLNEKECSCDTRDVDPRLEVLKRLLHE